MIAPTASTLDSLRVSAQQRPSTGPVLAEEGPLPARGYFDEDVLHLPPTSTPRFELELGGDTELNLLERAARSLSWTVRLSPDRSLPLEVEEEENDDLVDEEVNAKGRVALSVFWNDSNLSLERIRSLRVHCERLNHQPALAPLADPVRLVQLHARLSEADKGALAELYEYMPRSFVLPDDAAKLQRWLEDLRDSGERRFLI